MTTVTTTAAVFACNAIIFKSVHAAYRIKDIFWKFKKCDRTMSKWPTSINLKGKKFEISKRIAQIQ